MMFNRPTRYLQPRQEITKDDAALLRELIGLPHWQALIKLHHNEMADVTDDIIESKLDRSALNVLDRFKHKIEQYAIERPNPETDSLM